MYKYILGYDYRLKSESYVENLWTLSMREQHLLRQNVVWPLSVDTMLWQSIFSCTYGFIYKSISAECVYTPKDSDDFIQKTIGSSANRVGEKGGVKRISPANSKGGTMFYLLKNLS